MLQRLAWLSRRELIILLLASPLLLFPNSTFGVGMLIIPLLWVMRRVATGQFVVPTPFDIPIVVLLGMTGVGQLISADPAFSLAKSAGVVLGVGTYYAVVAAAQGRAGWWTAFLLFLGMNVGVAGISLFATAWGNKFPLFEPFLALLPRLIETLPGSPPEGFNPNGVAGIFLFGLPLFLMVALSRHGTLFEGLGRFRLLLRVGIIVATFLIGLLFIATQSRAGYISLAVAIMGLVILPRPRWMAISLLIGVVAVALFWVSPYRQPVVERFSAESIEGGALTSLAGRFLLWNRAVTAIGDFPVTGVGLGMFRFVQPHRYPLYTVPPQADVGHAHNQFLQAALDVGLPGMVAFAVLWGGAFLMGAKVIWQRRDALLYPAMVGLMAGWVGHFIWAGIEVHALGSKGGWFWWWALALMTATYHLSITHQPPLTERP
jgi:putative inorganic carbon (HCO3(-)) transporter